MYLYLYDMCIYLYIYVYIYISTSIYLSIYLSIHLSIYIFIYLSIYLSISFSRLTEKPTFNLRIQSGFRGQGGLRRFELINTVMCSEFPESLFINYKCFDMRFRGATWPNLHHKGVKFNFCAASWLWMIVFSPPCGRLI